MSQVLVDQHRKRRREDDTAGPVVSSAFQSAPSPRLRKRSRVPNIHGQQLPVNRRLEVLDKEGLQQLVTQLLAYHPEAETTIVNKITTRATVDECIAVVAAKLDAVISHMPYKCSAESDYSYLRVKPYLSELLACMSDFILHFLPPVETDITHSLTFLEAATSVLDELPNFTSSEYQYTRQSAYESVVNTWMLVLTCDGDDDSQMQKARLLTKMDAIECVSRHNEHAQGKFDPVIAYLKEHQGVIEEVSSTFGDLITMDYSKFCTSTVIE